MPITISDIQAIFAKYNGLCFGSKLPMPSIRIGYAKNYLGQLRYKVRKDRDGKPSYYDFTIHISQLYDMGQEKLEDVVIHEMIHYYIHYHHIQDSSAHGEVFRKMMNDINARLKRHISISDRSTLPVAEESQQAKLYLVCVVSLTSGDTGVAVCARSRAFEISDELPRRYDIENLTWYFTTDAFFNRYRRTNTAKLYRADKEEILRHLATATRLERMGNVIRPVTPG